ncbi:hypothetical protein H2200_008940 [Cladophialophora chaetospira]|uniref:Uncharacterized protein n=1 Tax=Cladophialophora chaetospira TaxID=386627 RepID=A0AA38X4Z0_9EURO|nr:hypothetical protein H2200_008940 [Cladophialophora chaetospira]
MQPGTPTLLFFVPGLLYMQAVAGQFNSDEPQGLCSYLYADANATSDGSFDGTFSPSAKSNGLGLWRVTVNTNYTNEKISTAQSRATEESPDAVANVWLDPFKGTDLNNGGNPYSACAFSFKGLPQNTIERGQHDDGTCTQMLSQKCVAALEEVAANSAKWLVQNPTVGPYSNLTPPILEPICQQISECAPYFDDGSPLYPTLNTYTLTDNVTKPVNCSFTDGVFGPHDVVEADYNSPPGFSFPYNGTSPAQAYDELVYTVWPVMTVVMPPANNTRYSSIANAYATLTCLRAKSISYNYRTPPDLPKPKAVHFPGPFSKGAIAGIAVGAVMGVAVVAAAAFWFWRRRKSRIAGDQKVAVGADLSKPPRLIDGKELYQLETKLAVAELDTCRRAEIGEDPSRELSGEPAKEPIAPQELPGSISVAPKNESSTTSMGE